LLALWRGFCREAAALTPAQIEALMGTLTGGGAYGTQQIACQVLEVDPTTSEPTPPPPPVWTESFRANGLAPKRLRAILSPRRMTGALSRAMHPLALSFSPPNNWRRSRRVIGVVLALVTVAPMAVLVRVMTDPSEAAKVHGLPLQMTLLLTAVVLPLLAGWIAALCFVGVERLRFEIADGALIVHTLLRSYRMPLRGVPMQRTDAKLNLRLAGTGLPGLYTGIYLLGDRRARVWATVRSGGVVIEGPKRWFVTPADVDGFLAAAQAAGAEVTQSS
jgi:hypothetical protein